jgi:hypothetical protein
LPGPEGTVVVVVVVVVGTGPVVEVVVVGVDGVAPDAPDTLITGSPPEVVGVELLTGPDAARAVGGGVWPLADTEEGVSPPRHGRVGSDADVAPGVAPRTPGEHGGVTTWWVEGEADTPVTAGGADRWGWPEAGPAEGMVVPEGATIDDRSSNMWSTIRAAGAGKPVAAASPVLPASTPTATVAATTALRPRR